jgi:hypothetical protein
MSKRTNKHFSLMLTFVLLLSVICFNVFTLSTVSAADDQQLSNKDNVNQKTPAYLGKLPDAIVGEWWWAWDPPTIGQVMSEAPQVNYLSIAGIHNGQGTGRVVTDFCVPNYTEDQMIADIDAWEASGRICVALIGGGGDGTVIQNETNVKEFMESIIPIIDKYHFQGIDFDFENSPNPDCIASIIKQLKSHYGPKFIIALSPRPYELRLPDGYNPYGVYRSVIDKAGIGNIDLVQPQFYALMGDSLEQQRKYMDADLSEWTSSGLIPAKKIAIGSFFPGDGWLNESITTAVDTYNYYKGVYPTLRGAINWETRDDRLNGWQFATQMGQAVYSSNLKPGKAK